MRFAPLNLADPSNFEKTLNLILLCSCLSIVGLLPGLQAQTPQPMPLQSSTQVLIVTTSDWNSSEGVLRRYERARPSGRWKAVGVPISVMLGKNGLGWGVGIMTTNNGRAHDETDPVKREGDGKAPAGLFHLTGMFGYAPQPPAGWKMPYVSLTPSSECVDDSKSRFYNRVVDRATVSPDWNSSEHMLRTDELYRWGIVVAHNANPAIPERGSCIFMHIWGGPGEATVGCTAMQRQQIESVLSWLDPTRLPLLIQLPTSQYNKLRKPWELPDLQLAGCETSREKERHGIARSDRQSRF